MLIFLMGFFYALNYHFAVFSKMMHIKDTVEVELVVQTTAAFPDYIFAL